MKGGDTMGKILIADDNEQITSILSGYAEKDGFESIIALDGAETLAKFHQYAAEIQIILLDVMMPKKDGFEVCREIRKTSMVPIIMITARGEDFEKIMGLDIGADDYIVKPFSAGEVMARIRAILRRLKMEEQTKKSFVLDNLQVDIEEYKVLVNDELINLTKKEVELLWTLARNKNKVFTRENLLDSIWGYDYYGDSRTVDSHIKRLRAKLESVPHKNWDIKTIWGVGYRFEELTDEK